MPKYASQTAVSSDKSRSEIERTLNRYGATSFLYGTRGATAAIQFEIANRRILFRLELPDPTSSAFTLTPSGNYKRSATQAKEAWKQACRQRWRALALILKAKLEAVEAGISTLETEFLPHTVLPGGGTVADWALPQVAQSYATGTMPAMLPG